MDGCIVRITLLKSCTLVGDHFDTEGDLIWYDKKEILTFGSKVINFGMNCTVFRSDEILLPEGNISLIHCVGK
jgi:hypothetical protein